MGSPQGPSPHQGTLHDIWLEEVSEALATSVIPNSPRKQQSSVAMKSSVLWQIIFFIAISDKRGNNPPTGLITASENTVIKVTPTAVFEELQIA